MLIRENQSRFFKNDFESIWMVDLGEALIFYKMSALELFSHPIDGGCHDNA